MTIAHDLKYMKENFYQKAMFLLHSHVTVRLPNNEQKQATFRGLLNTTYDDDLCIVSFNSNERCAGFHYSRIVEFDEYWKTTKE